MNILAELRGRFAAALAALADDAPQGVAAADLTPFADMVLPSQDAKFGDYQANCAMPLGKKLGKPPRDVAAQLVSALKLNDICDEPEVAGPGFINLRLRDAWLAERLTEALGDTENLGVSAVAEPRTYVLDYSSPNVAKPMHVGHIRSTAIGDALAKVLRALGHRVITDNHIGDWGTQFGMIIYGYKHFVDEAALAADAVPELSRLYRLVNQIGDHQQLAATGVPALEAKIAEAEGRVADLQAAPAQDDKKKEKQAAKKLRQAEGQLADLRKELAGAQEKLAAFEADAELSRLAAEHPAIGASALAETAKLHSGDEENVALWERFLPDCLEVMDEIYRRLGVTFDHTLGESFYHDRLAPVVEDLQAKNLARESDGAICVFLDGHDAPFLVRKKDGAFLYATTDLATIRYRMEEWRPDAILYVVDHRQSLHFEQLFATARLWGFDDLELEHVSFGTVLGDDGRPFKTRSGSAVGLMGLLDEAVERAHKILSENDDARPEPMLSADERLEAAERIGIGAIKYADLAHNRTSDYTFNYDKMLAMNGNTAAYMQYSCARVKSIFTRGGVDAASLRTPGAEIVLDSLAERALGLELLRLSETLARVAADYKPNHLTAYLFDLASRYSEFFEHCPVLKAESEELKTSRLRLCDLTARTLERGLGLLGIETVARM
ncbi:Arginine--tRNA ligase [Pseudobythopirellula maris]|uniref:Arginine--tRNA ligase n=1 Tax=Pseudobythopirellula maris TaxID=2527991 RepID=A0A5C5ZNT1_9BACT|nr:arginine--tRNA ligase [Pseudobythopirellula maris]TWT88567.1 Arginine--tRNA ligase [Pseudobythopirellula maris]